MVWKAIVDYIFHHQKFEERLIKLRDRRNSFYHVWRGQARFSNAYIRNSCRDKLSRSAILEFSITRFEYIAVGMHIMRILHWTNWHFSIFIGALNEFREFRAKYKSLHAKSAAFVTDGPFDTLGFITKQLKNSRTKPRPAYIDIHLVNTPKLFKGFYKRKHCIDGIAFGY